jgi:4-alpha-glucanotransferase
MNSTEPGHSPGRTALHALADAAGVATRYPGAFGHDVAIDDDVVEAVLVALGIDPTRPDEAAVALAAYRAALDGVVVAWDGALPAGLRTVGGVTTVPLGGHEVVLHDERTGERTTRFVIAAPRRAPRRDGRRAGVFAPVYALVSQRRPDVGDLAALEALYTKARALGAPGVLTLPLLACFPDEASPYRPISHRFWNELHLAPDRVPELAGRPAPVRRLGADGLIDHPAAHAALDGQLTAGLAALDDGHHPDRLEAFATYCARHPDVLAYGRFRAAGERHGRDWRRWPAAVARAGAVSTDAVDPRRARRHAYGQFLIEGQLDALAAAVRADGGWLGLDLPLGTHPDGFDTFADPDAFAAGISVGAPPDAFFPSGQDWGFAPRRPDLAARDQYRALVASARHHLGHATLLRIDHVMQFRRLYWIPSGASPTQGTYVSTPFEPVLAVLCLEAHLADAEVVGENLGLVPPEVDAALADHGVLGTWVAFAEIDGARRRPPRLTPPAGRLATLGTHDMATFAGFLAGRDLDDLASRGLLDDETLAAAHADRRADVAAVRADVAVGSDDAALLDALLDRLGRGEAELAVVNIEDLWLETEPQNVPGTSTERPNWRRPLRHRVDALPSTVDAGLTRLVAGRATGRQALP